MQYSGTAAGSYLIVQSLVHLYLVHLYACSYLIVQTLVHFYLAALLAVQLWYGNCFSTVQVRLFGLFLVIFSQTVISK